MKADRRLRRLVVGDTVWLWSVRQRTDRSDHGNHRLTLSLRRQDSRARLAVVFKPQADRIVSNSYFEAGTVVALPSRDWLNLYEPSTVRSLLVAVEERGGLPTEDGTTEVDGWPLFLALLGQEEGTPGHEGISPDELGAEVARG